MSQSRFFLFINAVADPDGGGVSECWNSLYFVHDIMYVYVCIISSDYSKLQDIKHFLEEHAPTAPSSFLCTNPWNPPF